MDRPVVGSQDLVKERGIVGNGPTVDGDIPGKGAPGGVRPSLAACEPAFQSPAQQPGRQVEREIERDLAGAKPLPAAGHHFEGWPPARATLLRIVDLDLLDQGRGSEVSAHAGELLSDAFGQGLHATPGAAHPQPVSLQADGGVGERHGFRAGLGGVL